MKKLFVVLAVVFVMGTLTPSNADAYYRHYRHNHGVRVHYGGYGYWGWGHTTRHVHNYCSYYNHPAYQWIPGQWIEEERQVWVEGPMNRIWVEPVLGESVDPYTGQNIKTVVDGGYYQLEKVPGQYETRKIRRYIPGYYQPIPAAQPVQETVQEQTIQQETVLQQEEVVQ